MPFEPGGIYAILYELPPTRPNRPAPLHWGLLIATHPDGINSVRIHVKQHDVTSWYRELSWTYDALRSSNGLRYIRLGHTRNMSHAIQTVEAIPVPESAPGIFNCVCWTMEAIQSLHVAGYIQLTSGVLTELEQMIRHIGKQALESKHAGMWRLDQIVDAHSRLP
ncbi:hypothetical protein SCP_0801040 [Sparassis crispa]|uniref:Uncharacterized protein n=1 Tax=Sparassis crispa TaxID=139825 RepID=A0A401GTP6_9APHY|nr:hypothetical protein SCP_0801040 [Sparassis crispa]GBE85587.1 hypothetical protein SCP_0801040 [Sparassis crispa]